MIVRQDFFAILGLLLLPACALFESELPEDPLPLADMEAPPHLQEEPDDEEARRALPLGSFTGVYAEDLGDLMSEMEFGAAGITVERIVENSPGHAAGIQVGDLITQVHAPPEFDRAGIDSVSVWHRVEDVLPAGRDIEVELDREGRSLNLTLTLEARVAPRERHAITRLREEEYVGVFVRTATEVEARAAGLGAGGGAVITGLSARSPWRVAGLELGDLIVAIDGRTITHPQIVLDAIRGAAEKEEMEVEIVRAGTRKIRRTRTTQREHELRSMTIPLLFSFEDKRDKSEWAFLLGLLGNESTRVASRFRFLWFFTIESGEANLLEEVDG